MWGGEHNPKQPLPDAFLRIPAQVYRKDPYWLGENTERLQARFSHANGFFQQGRIWLGGVGDEVRAAAFIHPDQRIEGEPVAYFGFWETRNALAANRALFAALEAWVKAQGVKALYGPIDFNTYGNNRLRLNDFDQPCFPGEPYNPRYYPELLQQLGYQIACRYQSRFHPDTPALAQELQPRLQALRAQLEGQFDLQPLSADFWLSHLDELHPIVDRIFRQNFAYTPIDLDQFRVLCGAPFARRFCTRSSILATTKAGEIAGFFLCYPDYGPLLRQANANPMAAEAINYDEHFDRLPRPRLALAKTGGVHPDFRQSGLFNWMGMQLVENAAPHYETIAGALMREDNPSLRFGMVCPIQRDYGLFRKILSN